MYGKIVGVIDKDITIDRLVHVAKEKFPECTITLKPYPGIDGAYIISGLEDAKGSFNGQITAYRDNLFNEEEEATKTNLNIDMCQNGLKIMVTILCEFGGKLKEVIGNKDSDDCKWIKAFKNVTIDWTAYYETVDKEQKEKRQAQLEERKERIAEKLFDIETELSQIKGTPQKEHLNSIFYSVWAGDVGHSE